MPPVQNIDLQLKIDVLTTSAIAQFVNEILEFLLYQRNQIPFVYKTYKYYVTKWYENEDDNQDEQCTTKTFQVQRQRELAKQTKDAISNMREAIRQTFKQNTVKTIRFLFGATTFTPKEVYTIHIPTESINRRYNSMPTFSQAEVNQTLISLITSAELYAIFSNTLPATNIFMELELFDEAPKDSTVKVFPKELTSLPRSCKHINLNLLHTRPAVQSQVEQARRLDFSQPLQIYQEESIETEPVDTVTPMSTKASKFNNGAAWWEADIVVRGFKEQKTKSFSIWNI